MAEEKDYIDQYVDRGAVLKDTEFLLDQLKQVDAMFTKLQSVKVSINGASTTKDTISSMKEAQTATEALIKAKEKLVNVDVAAAKESARLSKQLVDSATKLAAAETQEAKAAALVKEELRKKNAEMKNSIREETSARGSIEQLRASLIRLQRQYDNLSASQRNGAFGKRLLTDIRSVSTEVKALEAETNRFQRNVGNYPKLFGGIGTGLKTLFAGFLGIAGIQKAFGFLSDSVKEFNEAEDGLSRLHNTLENVGRTDAFERLQGKAKELAAEFKTIDDDEVIGVFDKLITFGKLTENQINQLTPVIINFAAKQKISLAESASVIIKALEGQGRALKEYGIDMKDAGSVSEAFGLIMGDLAPKVEEAAKAFGETTQGQIKATKVEIGELKEAIGEELQPVVFSFWSGLKDSIIGIKSFFEGLGNGFNSLVDDFSRGLRLLKGLATFDFDDIKKMGEEQERINKNQKDMARFHQQRAAAESVARDVAAKSEEEQNKILRDEQALLQASFDAHQKFIKAGTSSSKAGREAARQYFEDLNRVKKIEDAIAVSRDKRVLGSGGKINGTDTTELKAQKQKFFSDELKAEIDQSKKLSEIETLHITTRVNARKKAADIEKQIAEGERDVELQNEIDKLNAVKNNKQSSANTITNAVNEFKQREVEITEKYNSAILKSERDLNSDLIEIKQSSNAKQLSDDKKFNEETLKFFEDSTQKKINALLKLQEEQLKNSAQDKDVDVERLNKEYTKRIEAAKGNQKKIEKIEQEFAERRAQIEFEYAARVLRIEIKTAEEIIKLRRSQGQDVTSEEKALAEARMSLSDLETDHIISNNQKQTKSHREKVQELSNAISQVKEYSDQVFGVIGSLIDANATAEKNKLQEQSDNIEKKRDKEIEAVEQSIASEQDKAAKIAIINARARAQKDQIERKQREIDQQKARFNKAKAITDIILNTAIAITKFLSEGNIPASIAAGVIGAAELAIAAAAPIPKYAKGTDHHKGGPMIVGDGGKRELVEYPTGERYITSDKATLTAAPRGTKVFPDADKILGNLMHSSMKSVPDAPINENSYGQMMSQELGRKLDTLTTTIKNKRETHINGTHGGVVAMHRWGQNYLKYIDEQTNF
jgi:hypothetical protein